MKNVNRLSDYIRQHHAEIAINFCQINYSVIQGIVDLFHSQQGLLMASPFRKCRSTFTFRSFSYPGWQSVEILTSNTLTYFCIIVIKRTLSMVKVKEDVYYLNRPQGLLFCSKGKKK